jgi:glycosyltransferase involved in cell wall biosynthesis
MSLSIIYHIYKNSKTLEASLQSLLDQTDNNFELALVNDGAMRGVTQILKNINIHNFKHLTYCK